MKIINLLEGSDGAGVRAVQGLERRPPVPLAGAVRSRPDCQRRYLIRRCVESLRIKVVTRNLETLCIFDSSKERTMEEVWMV